MHNQSLIIYISVERLLLLLFHLHDNRTNCGNAYRFYVGYTFCTVDMISRNL